jgi:N utilization substance protein B
VARQRRRSRVLAFQTLYESDLSGHPPAEVLDRLCEELRVGEEARDYARNLVRGVLESHQEIDALISSLASAWPIDQMSVVDRNLLRLGIFEVTHNSSTIPVAVAINEAVELAKLYGSDASSRLINGVLGNVAGGAERPRDATAESGTGTHQQGQPTTKEGPSHMPLRQRALPAGREKLKPNAGKQE